MKSASQHWWSQRLSAIILIPFIVWMAIFVFGRMTASYEEARLWLSEPVNGGLMIWALFVLYWHTRLGLRVVAEDYLANAVRRRWLLLGVNSILLVLIIGATVAICGIMRF